MLWDLAFSIGTFGHNVHDTPELIKYSSGHTDTNMTKQYTNLDKVELSRSFPDIVAIKESAIDGKNLPRAHNQGHTELYSNFGFMHVT